MNILIIVSSLSYGGAEKQAVLDANWLSNSHKVHLVSFTKGPLMALVNSSVEYLQLPKTGYLNAAKHLTKLVKRFEIDVVYSFLFSPMIISALSTLSHSAKIIWAFHSHEYDIPLKSKISFALLARMPGVNKIVFVSRELKTFFKRRFYLPGKKLDILYNATSVEAADATLSKEKKDSFNIGYVGRFVELKRVDILIELAKFLNQKKITEFKVHLVGDGPEKGNLERMTKDLNVSDKIVFHGFQEDVQSYYDTFDLFINPSREECLSIALIDAGVRGAPSIAFDAGGNNEIIKDHQSGFIVNTKEELFTKCLFLLENEKLRWDFGETAIRHCSQYFSKHAHIAKLTALFT